MFRVSNINNLKSYYESDVLLNLAPYMDKMPNLKATFTDLEWGRVSFDGGIYAIPRKGEGNYNCWYIRQDWLDKLQMDAPETFDDLLKVAIAMNNADFDGNGKNDTYALSGTYDSKYNRSAFDGFYTAYGVTAPAGILIRDGKAVMSCTLPEFRMALETIRTFVEAGVVDPEILSNTNSTMIEKMATGKVGIAYGGWANYSKPAFVKQLSAVDENASWGPMSKNIKTEYGESGASQSASGYDAVFAINADLAQEPEKLDAVLKLFDYLATEEGMLPLKNAKRIAVIGPSADDIRAQYGDWTYFTHPQHEPDQITPVRPYTTLLEGMREAFPDAEIVYAKGCGFYPDDEADIDAAAALARGCDAIILALGDTVRQTGEHRDRADLALSGRQSELFAALRALHIPLALTLILSKPLCAAKEAAQADAVLVAFNGGMAGGRALAEVLSGTYAPTGRLPISFPVHTGQIPVYYNALPGWHGGKYVDMPQEPLFAFGEGLGYTTFAYDGLAFDPEELCLSVTVRNTGAAAGTETVQVYLRDLVSSVMTPVKRLIAFQKVSLAPGESRRVCFRLRREDFMLVAADGRSIAEPGLFRLMAGHSAKDADLLSLEWRLNEEWR